MGMSDQRYSYKFIKDLFWPSCNAEREDECHYIVHCNTYNDIRNIMITELRNIFTDTGLGAHFDHLLVFSKRQFVTVLLWGFPKQDIKTNQNIFDTVQSFIMRSKRFQYWITETHSYSESKPPPAFFCFVPWCLVFCYVFIRFFLSCRELCQLVYMR